MGVSKNCCLPLVLFLRVLEWPPCASRPQCAARPPCAAPLPCVGMAPVYRWCGPGVAPVYTSTQARQHKSKRANKHTRAPNRALHAFTGKLQCSWQLPWHPTAPQLTVVVLAVLPPARKLYGLGVRLGLPGGHTFKGIELREHLDLLVWPPPVCPDQSPCADP
jgi:hypothetical protein